MLTTDAVMTPAAITKTVCENCSQMYPQMNPTTQNEKTMYLDGGASEGERVG